MRKRKLVITERDKSIFRDIYEQRTMLEKHIRERHFANRSPSVPNERLKELVKSEYLVKKSAIIKGKKLAHYFLKEKALPHIRYDFEFDIESPCLKSSSVIHDLHLVDIRRRLEKCQMVQELFTENILQTSDCLEMRKLETDFASLNTDLLAHIRIEKEDYWLPFEWERNQKGKSKLMEKLLNYYLAPDIELVFYICQDEKIISAIRHCEKELGKNFEPKVFTCLLENVLNNNGNILFENARGQVFELS